MTEPDWDAEAHELNDEQAESLAELEPPDDDE